MLDDRDIAALNRIAEALEALVPLLTAMTGAQQKLANPAMKVNDDGTVTPVVESKPGV